MFGTHSYSSYLLGPLLLRLELLRERSRFLVHERDLSRNERFLDVPEQRLSSRASNPPPDCES